MNKIIIEVNGGLVQAIHSTDPEIQILLIDYDNLTDGDQAAPEVVGPDTVFAGGTAHLLYLDDDPVSVEIRDELKRIKF